MARASLGCDLDVRRCDMMVAPKRCGAAPAQARGLSSTDARSACWGDLIESSTSTLSASTVRRCSELDALPRAALELERHRRGGAQDVDAARAPYADELHVHDEGEHVGEGEQQREDQD